MDGYDFSEVKGPHRSKKPGDWAWNVLTILVLCITIFLAVVFILIYINPNSILNPFPPQAVNSTATSTASLRFNLAPSTTAAVATVLVPVTSAPAPTSTSATPAILVENPTGSPQTYPNTNEYAFVIRQGSPAASDGSQFHPEAGCDWSGVAGQVTSLNGEAVNGLFVLLGGSIPEIKSLNSLSMTGLAPQYGQGGFEITLSDSLFASQGALWIQLVDQQNLPLSDRVYFDTYNDCAKNLILIYFDQVR